jgi:hypothetical protein
MCYYYDKEDLNTCQSCDFNYRNFKEKDSKVSDFIIRPCPKCKSEDISIIGCNWIQVECRECEHTGQPFSYGTRCDRMHEAIIAWNEESL